MVVPNETITYDLPSTNEPGVTSGLVVVKLPPRVIVLPVFATPVPPYVPKITLPFQVPIVTVPALNTLSLFQLGVPSASI